MSDNPCPVCITSLHRKSHFLLKHWLMLVKPAQKWPFITGLLRYDKCTPICIECRNKWSTEEGRQTEIERWTDQQTDRQTDRQTYSCHAVVLKSPCLAFCWHCTTKGCNSISYCTNRLWKKLDYNICLISSEHFWTTHHKWINQ